MNRLVACLSAVVAASAVGCGGEDAVVGGGGSLNPGAVDGGGVDGSVLPVGNDAGLPEGGSPKPVNCTADNPNADQDNDGVSAAQGDCNDCDKSINPGAYDFPGNEYDEDCSGSAATAADVDCDNGLPLDSSNPEDAARALGICKFTTADKKDWGIISARFTTADGSGTKLDSPMQVGLLPSFGDVDPRAGKSLLALSSGVARAPGQPGYTESSDDDFGAGITAGKNGPPGYPKASSSCSGTGILKSVFNQAALELKIRVPTNANSLTFDNIFYSYEYPEYICADFNDFFVTLLEPHDMGDGNIVFDSNKDPIGVNAGLLAVCDPTTQTNSKRFACEQGTGLLANTGFGKGEYTMSKFDLATFMTKQVPGIGGASTGWLTTASPVKAGSVITLRFAIWDTGDSNVDSTVLIDRFNWSVNMPTGASTVATPVLL